MRLPYRMREVQGRVLRARQLRRPGAPERIADVLVSVTSYPARVGHLDSTVRSLIDQRVAPAEIHVVLAATQFPDGPLDLPDALNTTVRRSPVPVRLQFVPEDDRSYKKLLPLLRQEPGATIVTADDDVLYNRNWLSTLLETSATFPGHVVGTRARRMTMRDDSVGPYADWTVVRDRSAGSDLFLTGRGGILYPPASLAPEVHDVVLARRLCPDTDDVWFKAMALLRGSRAACSPWRVDDPSNRAAGISALHVRNVGESQNDVAVRNVFGRFGLTLEAGR